MINETVQTIVRLLYPVNSAGFDDPDVDLDKLEKEIDETFAEVKAVCRQKKIFAIRKSIRGLENWLAKNVNRQGKPLEDYQKEWAREKITEYNQYVAENTVEVPKSITDDWQKEISELQ